MGKKKILLAGESWMSYTTHVKGVDAFYTSSYETGEKWLKAALEGSGFEVRFLPNHEAVDGFPFTLGELSEYCCIILSDIGANTLLLPTKTFTTSKIMPNRCDLIRDYVLGGGGLLMVGGYLTFSGIDAKGKWHDTAVQQVLPVEVLTVDDRQEHCEGIAPKVGGSHPALVGLPAEWPSILGYNKTLALPGSAVPVTVGGDPLVAFGEYGKGRSAVVTTDCAPHWAPPEFCTWKHYPALWAGICEWLAGVK